MPMPNHDYTAKDALALLDRKIEGASPTLAKQILSAINAGKDVQMEEMISLDAANRKAKKRFYRKHIAYTDEEALHVAMTVLESHLVESRMLVNSTQGDFKEVGLASPKKLKPHIQPVLVAQSKLPLDVELKDEVVEILHVAEAKVIAVESEPEAVKEKKNLPDVHFEPIDPEQLASLHELFKKLKTLTDFQEANHGNPR
jgi:hypothetical protein